MCTDVQMRALETEEEVPAEEEAVEEEEEEEEELTLDAAVKQTLRR